MNGPKRLGSSFSSIYLTFPNPHFIHTAFIRRIYILDIYWVTTKLYHIWLRTLVCVWGVKAYMKPFSVLYFYSGTRLTDVVYSGTTATVVKSRGAQGPDGTRLKIDGLGLFSGCVAQG